MSHALDYTLAGLFYGNLITQEWPAIDDGDLAYISCLCSDSSHTPPEQLLRDFCNNDPSKLYALQEDERLLAKSVILAVAEEVDADSPICMSIAEKAQVEPSLAYHMLRAAVMRIHHEDDELLRGKTDIAGLREFYAHPVVVDLTVHAPAQSGREHSDDEMMAHVLRQAQAALEEAAEEERIRQQRDAALVAHAQRVARYNFF